MKRKSPPETTNLDDLLSEPNFDNLNDERLLPHSVSESSLLTLNHPTGAGSNLRFKLQRQTTQCVLKDLPLRGELEYQKINISETNEETCHDTLLSCQMLHECMLLRDKWMQAYSLSSDGPSEQRESVMKQDNEQLDLDNLPSVQYVVLDRQPSSVSHDFHFVFSDGIVRVQNSSGKINTSFRPQMTFSDFVTDYIHLRRVVYSGPVRSYCHKHLELLLSLFNMHALLNLDRESVESKGCGGRDFYNVRKVDTHVHHSACMGERHLLTFMRNKLLNHSHDIVLQKSGKPVTLGDVFSSLGLTVHDLSIDTLDMHAHNTFQRFDRFNLKYNPAGQSSLREIFLKTDNFISGRYLAEMTREVMDVLTEQRYTICEWRISIYGKSNEEWKALARWFYTHRLAHENVRWLIQIPRRFEQFRKDNSVENFEQFLKNIFQPLVEATLDPSGDIALSYFMDAVVGFDTVDDESQPESGSINSLSAAAALPLPRDWTAPDNPPYSYWLYYLHANISVLNQLRQIRGMSAFSFRPHCGEAGDADHLLAAYLVAHEINHGINLKKLPGLHFLYYLSQVGIAMSPISNNRLFLDYNKNPFPTFFRQGLNVSLSTDDPLLLHSTSDPLVEEYSVAAQVYRLSPTDLCEIARNSVLQSGLEDEYKRHYLGDNLEDIRKTNVPSIRLRYPGDSSSVLLFRLMREIYISRLSINMAYLICAAAHRYRAETLQMMREKIQRRVITKSHSAISL